MYLIKFISLPHYDIVFLIHATAFSPDRATSYFYIQNESVATFDEELQNKNSHADAEQYHLICSPCEFGNVLGCPEDMDHLPSPRPQRQRHPHLGYQLRGHKRQSRLTEAIAVKTKTNMTTTDSTSSWCRPV